MFLFLESYSYPVLNFSEVDLEVRGMCTLQKRRGGAFGIWMLGIVDGPRKSPTEEERQEYRPGRVKPEIMAEGII